MDVSDVTRHAIQIEKLHKNGNYADISSLLADLCNTRITLEQLQNTDIAKTVYQLLKSCPVASVRKTAKGLLSEWKRLYKVPYHKKITDTSLNERDLGDISKVETSDPGGAPHLGREVKDDWEMVGSIGTECDTVHEMKDKKVSSGETSSKETSEHGSRKGMEDIKDVDSLLGSYSGEEDSRGTSTVLAQPCSSTNSADLRAKCVELLLQALTTDQKTPPEPSNRLSTIAQAIEDHIHTLHGHSQSKYKSCTRSKVANLKNPKNPHLRQGLLTGTLAAEEFVRMSAEEMAGEELRRLRAGYTAAGISEHQLPQRPEGTPTTKVRCRRCGGMDCRVTQVSRGTLFLPSWVKNNNADEDAVTFVTCAGCGEQWYHSRWVCL